MSVARKCGNIESGFELIDEAQIGAWQLLEAAHAEIGQVGRDVGHPAEIAGWSDNAAVCISGAGKPTPNALRRAVERDVDIAIAGNLAARRFEGQRVALLVPEEPLVFIGGLHREVGHLNLGLCCRRRSLRCAGFGGSRLSLSFAGLSFCRLGVGVALLLFGFELLHFGLELINLHFKRAKVIRRLSFGDSRRPQQRR